MNEGINAMECYSFETLENVIETFFFGNVQLGALKYLLSEDISKKVKGK